MSPDNPPARAPRLAHITDLHVALRPGPGEWNAKRLLGFVNHRLFRGRRYLERVAAAALSALMEDPPDVVLLTGDATQLGLDAEFGRAEALLSVVTGRGTPIIAVAGNHDIYGGTSAARFREFRRRISLGLEPDESGIVRIPGLDILPLEQGVPSLPFFSNGRQEPVGLERASRAWPDGQGVVPRVVCGHYPAVDPHEFKRAFFHGLRGAGELAAFCGRKRVAAYFCGHYHRRFAAPLAEGCVQYAAPSLSDVGNGVEERVPVYVCDADGVREMPHHAEGGEGMQHSQDWVSGTDQRGFGGRC